LEVNFWVAAIADSEGGSTLLIRLFAVYCLLFTIPMWDAKRQLIWLAAGLAFGTFVAYADAHTEDGVFVPRFFFFMESLVLIIIATLFYVYSRKKP
jgi:hypothetical protein